MHIIHRSKTSFLIRIDVKDFILKPLFENRLGVENSDVFKFVSLRVLMVPCSKSDAKILIYY